jgi:cation transport regulator ChaC
MPTPSADCFYFAYGSNMNLPRKEGRTGTVREARRARLHGYRFAFNKRSYGREQGVYANIVPDTDGVVSGVVYRCTAEVLDELDRYEGVAEGHYERLQVEVMTDDGETVTAVAYIAGKNQVCKEGRPARDYLRLILEGARANRLPPDYVARLEELAAGP